MKKGAALGIMLALSAGCATIQRTDNSATQLTDAACGATMGDPTGIATLAICGGAVIHRGAWWIEEKMSSSPKSTPAPVADTEPR